MHYFFLFYAGLKDSAGIAFAKKNFPGYTSWFMVMLSTRPKLGRYIFQKSGTNIYDGKVIHLTLAPDSTVLLDSQSGKIILLLM